MVSSETSQSIKTKWAYKLNQNNNERRTKEEAEERAKKAEERAKEAEEKAKKAEERAMQTK